MESIAKPNKVEFLEGQTPNEATVVIEPFYPGYGMTVGNSLRRVLLSSLPGTAVIGVKIEGASHEFATIPYVKEDVLEIIMNLKKLKVKILIDTDEEIKLELEVRGKKEVKASDIKKDSRVEIASADMVIANITDNAGFLKMEITIAKGRGYRPVEAIEAKDKKGEIGYIDMDALFSPVLLAGLKVENVRVGKMTNWDKLMLNIITDGTISPEEAYKEAVIVLQEQVNALVIGKKVEEKVEKAEKEEAVEAPEPVEAEDVVEVEDDEEGDKELKKANKKAKKAKKVK
jgi:DNA-directed RNA polymerase subunit alpha